MKRFAEVGCLLACVGLMGCGGSEFTVAKTKGTVMCDGKPVPYVTVYVQPLPKEKKQGIVGKQGIGYADPGGNFIVGTYDTADGAVIGKSRVLVGPPMGEVPSDFKCECVLSEVEPVMEVEIVSGKPNVLEIQLKKAANDFERQKQQKVMAKLKAEQDD